jgi:hypothetical protein
VGEKGKKKFLCFHLILTVPSRRLTGFRLFVTKNEKCVKSMVSSSGNRTQVSRDLK